MSHTKQRLHKVGYFAELMSSSEEIDQSIRPLLKLSREHIVRAQRLDYALVGSLERDPLLAERLERLRTVPGVGPITALTWALEIGDVSRFRSIKQAISYCGLCGAEKSSADKVVRTPISKQRNKHIQHVLIEAAKLAPRQCPELALIYEKEMQRGNRNRATLAVARKIVAYLLAVERRNRISCLPKNSEAQWQPKSLPKNEKHQDYSVRRLLGPAIRPLGEGVHTPEAPHELFRDWQRTQTQLQMDVWFCLEQEPKAERPPMRYGLS